jgi:hypothetical protein
VAAEQHVRFSDGMFAGILGEPPIQARGAALGFATPGFAQGMRERSTGSIELVDAVRGHGRGSQEQERRVKPLHIVQQIFRRTRICSVAWQHRL